jgi:hypothetical protein
MARDKLVATLKGLGVTPVTTDKMPDVTSNPAETLPCTAVTAVTVDSNDTAIGNVRDDKGRFKTGNSGGGRPRGAKNKLTDLVLSVIIADFEEHGAATVARLRKTDPEMYLRLVSALVPREMILRREKEPNIDYADLTIGEVEELRITEGRRRTVTRVLNSA